MRRSLLFAGALLAGCLSPATEDDSARSGDDALVGGTDARPEDFPSTVMIQTNRSQCTASKIAPNKILTAAHCVTETNGSVIGGAGADRLDVTSAPNPFTTTTSPIRSTDPRRGFVQIRMAGVYVDAGWRATQSRSAASDLAVVLVADEDVGRLASIPIAQLDLEPVADGTDVTVMGYGCDVGYGIPRKDPPRLKYAFNQASSIDATRARNFTTTAQVNGAASSLCPGDSGGPVYRGKSVGAGARIIGVNQSIDLQGTVTVSGSHARVSDTWLSQALADSSPPGTYVPFAGGTTVRCAESTGVVVGAIADKYLQFGGCTGPLGKAAHEERPTPDRRGRFIGFGAGSIYWTPELGAHAVLLAHRNAWEALAWETGPLRYPTSDTLETARKDGLYTSFEGGSVFSSANTGVHAVYGRIFEKWRELGYELGPLGFPTSDEHAVDGGRRSDFEKGTITWVAARDEVVVATTP